MSRCHTISPHTVLTHTHAACGMRTRLECGGAKHALPFPTRPAPTLAPLAGTLGSPLRQLSPHLIPTQAVCHMHTHLVWWGPGRAPSLPARPVPTLMPLAGTLCTPPHFLRPHISSTPPHLVHTHLEGGGIQSVRFPSQHVQRPLPHPSSTFGTTPHFVHTPVHTHLEGCRVQGVRLPSQHVQRPISRDEPSNPQHQQPPVVN